MKQKNENVKIIFKFFSNVLDEWTVETMWAKAIDKTNGFYKLDTIPFYAPVASDDVVLAEYDQTEQQLIYRKTIQPSSNSTIQVVIMDKSFLTNDIHSIGYFYNQRLYFRKIYRRLFCN